MKEIIKSNCLIIGLYVFLIIFFIYLFRDNIRFIQTLCILQGILFLVALTPVFSYFMRILNHAYRPNLQDKKEISLIFDEVYQEAKYENPKLSAKIELFLNNDIEPNAFALGTNTIVITKGALHYFDEEELKGVLAHEFGHLAHWDTKILLLIMSSNLIILFLTILVRVIFFIITFLTGNKDDYRIRITVIIKTILAVVISFAIHAFISLSRRQSENMADEFAWKLGYGTGLINALYKIQSLEANQKLSLKERIMSDHPETARRIRKLEIMV